MFSPTGENSDHVGFSLLSVEGGNLNLLSQGENILELVKDGNVNRQRITRLSVNLIDDFFADAMFGGVRNVTRGKIPVTVVGFLMVCTNYSIYWYRIGITTVDRQNEYSVCLDHLGCADLKMLRGNAVASACWSPHLSEECLVLLENGDLLLFEMVRSISLVSGNNGVVKKKMHVSLADKLGIQKEESGDQGRRWFGCEFSWHPRIFIASHLNEVFLVDTRSSGVPNVSCLLKLDMLSVAKNNGFFAISRAGSDGFFFTVTTRNLLLLFDVRRPLMPVLRWAHGIRNPRYMTVFSLSDLRANAKDTEYKVASETGYCVMLGSFWDNEFDLFCYGPDVNANGSASSEIAKVCNLYYAWGLPSALLLSSYGCNCGSCLVREEFSKASHPVWVDWRQKKDLILGFGIVKPELSAQLSSVDSFGGFMLLRLTSSGRLEMQQFSAVWESKSIMEEGHKRKRLCSEDNLLYDYKVPEYDGVKKFQHLKLEFLNAYLKGKLAKHMAERRQKMKDSDEDALKKSRSQSKSNQEIYHRLKASGLPRERSNAVSSVLEDISLPTSIHEIALRSMCAVLPTNILQLAFSTYSDLDEDLVNHNKPLDLDEDLMNHNVPLEFLDLPEQLHVPPFPFRKPSYRSNKWSSKVRPSDALVGPVLPPLFLTTLHKLCLEELKEERELYVEESKAFSPRAQLVDQCNKVMEVVEEHVSGADDKTEDDDFISLAEDTEHMNFRTQKLKCSYHKPSAFLENQKSESDYIFSTHVFRRRQEFTSGVNAEMVGQELFDMGCPIELNFGDVAIDFGPKEQEALRKLKQRDLDFQRSFKPYQDYINGKDELKHEIKTEW